MDLMELLKTTLPSLTEDTDDSIEDAERSIPMKEPPKRWRNKYYSPPSWEKGEKGVYFGALVHPTRELAEQHWRKLEPLYIACGWVAAGGRWLGAFPVEE